jgi:large subunit ribosomal protein L25
MAGSFVFEAEARLNTGKGDARRLRRAGKVPAILYGGSGEPVALILEHNAVLKNLENEAVYSHILTIKLNGAEESAILKAIQRHPSRPMVMHMDFLRVNAADKIRVHVPLHFVNQETSVGVKKGGVVTHNLVDVEVSCLPTHLPEFIEVNMAQVDIGQTVHLSDIRLPGGVEIVALTHGPEHDTAVAVVQASRTADSGEGGGGSA